MCFSSTRPHVTQLSQLCLIARATITIQWQLVHPFHLVACFRPTIAEIAFTFTVILVITWQAKPGGSVNQMEFGLVICPFVVSVAFLFFSFSLTFSLPMSLLVSSKHVHKQTNRATSYSTSVVFFFFSSQRVTSLSPWTTRACLWTLLLMLFALLPFLTFLTRPQEPECQWTHTHTTLPHVNK